MGTLQYYTWINQAVPLYCFQKWSCLFAGNKGLRKNKGNLKAWKVPVWTWYGDVIINSVTLIPVSNRMGVTADCWWRQDDLVVLKPTSTIFMTKKHIWSIFLVPKILSIYFIWICLCFFLVFHSILIPQVPRLAVFVLIIYMCIYILFNYILKFYGLWRPSKEKICTEDNVFLLFLKKRQ